MCITLPKIWATYSFNTHGQTHIRDRKYTGFPITFIHTGVLVYEWHVSLTQYTLHYTMCIDLTIMALPHGRVHTITEAVQCSCYTTHMHNKMKIRRSKTIILQNVLYWRKGDLLP